MGLDPVAVGIDDEGGVVARTVVGAQAGPAVVASAGPGRSGVEGVHALRRRRGEAEMQADFMSGGTGCSAVLFILHTRLNRAAVRLRRTTDTISAVAYAAGFNDLSTFNRRFQRIMGRSPSAYRTESPR